MGQRHQAYLIARITPYGQPPGETRYRCIAALHHQWCYGCLPLKATTRFLTLIKQNENARVIRHEIHSIHGLYGTFMTPPEVPDVPCPFTHFLMHSAWSSDLNDPEQIYESNGIILPASMGSTDGDNNDGITIIDVTDPESPAYCFVFLSSYDPEMTPLSATQYLRSYYPEPTSESETDETSNQRKEMLEQSITLRPFESLPMITIDMLAEAWPGEYKLDEQNLSGLLPKAKESSTTSAHMLPSLVDLMFVPALNHALQTGETDRLDPLVCLPGNVSKIKETLRSHKPLTAVGFALLSKVIPVEVKQTKSIDLSHFYLTGEQVTELVSAQEGVEILDLSHMQQITADILRELIPTLPNLRRLVLLHTIPDADILSLYSESPELFYRIESFIHSAFLRPLGHIAFPPVFSHIVSGRSRISTFLPYFTPDQLVQGLTDHLSLFTAGDNSYCDRPMPLLASEVRGPGRSWSERIVPFIPGMRHENFNKPEGWFLAWLVSSCFDRPSLSYTFAKLNKEVMEEYHRRIDELTYFPIHSDKPQNSDEGQVEGDAKLDDDPGANISLWDKEMRAKATALESEYADREFHIFDVESFFQELVNEGRPAPSPEALAKLLEIFAILQKTKGLCVMTQPDLRSFFD